eukprot:GHVR01168252.1.p1 GENE.GHVR01168252.1~~GHVR01168252.1.p1  ORF type:complete len:234 (-),score=28.81 GHVR01168252.1:134-835(-)
MIVSTVTVASTFILSRRERLFWLVIVNCLVMLVMRVPQDAYAAPRRDASHRDPDNEVGPVAAQPPNETARDQDAAVRCEIVEAEGVGGPDVHVRFLQSPEQPDAGEVDDRSYQRHCDHQSSERFGTADIAPPSVNQNANRKDQKQSAGYVRGTPLPLRRPGQGQKADAIDEAVGCVVETIGDQGAGIADSSRGEEPRSDCEIETENNPERLALFFILPAEFAFDHRTGKPFDF